MQLECLGNDSSKVFVEKKKEKVGSIVGVVGSLEKETGVVSSTNFSHLLSSK